MKVWHFVFKNVKVSFAQTAVLFKVGQNSMMMNCFQVIPQSMCLCNDIVGFQEKKTECSFNTEMFDF